ncbi:delta-aminolevulinic acid dehydratase [Mycobacteroides abscessus subsp. abscessus]|nr:delta-aminolevulinic acid dehydratase [Mycobacteroides abscessus subsp. abscessus]
MAETTVEPRHLVLPMFVADGLDEPREIGSMPGVQQHSMDSLRKAATEAVSAGVGGLMLFGVPRPEDKDPAGSQASDPDGILNRGLRALAEEVGDATVIMADTCLEATAGCSPPTATSTTTPPCTAMWTWRSRRPRPGQTCSAPAA